MGLGIAVGIFFVVFKVFGGLDEPWLFVLWPFYMEVIIDIFALVIGFCWLVNRANQKGG